MRYFLIIVLFNFHAAYNHLCCAQSSEADYKEILNKRMGRLLNIEGIYEVDLTIGKPIVFDNSCLYPSYTLNNYDRIAILYNGNQIDVFSFTFNRLIGTMEMDQSWFNKYKPKNPEGLPSASQRILYRFISNGLNYLSARHAQQFQLSNSFVLFDNDLEELEMNKKFDYNVVKNANIKCYSYSSFSKLEVNFKAIARKIYPNEYEIPDEMSDNQKSGSGFIISPDGYLITNAHVVLKEKKENFVWNPIITTWQVKHEVNPPISFSENIQVNYKNQTFIARPIYVNPEKDVAILKIGNPQSIFNYVIFDTSELNLGESVYALGYPLSNTIGNAIKFTKGYVSSEIGYNYETFTLNMGINPGNSGGPICNEKNNYVRGIIVARLNDEATGVKSENIGYAIYPNELIRLIKNDKIKKNISTDSTYSPSWFDEYEKIKCRVIDAKYKPQIEMNNNKDATVLIIAS